MSSEKLIFFNKKGKMDNQELTFSTRNKMHSSPFKREHQVYYGILALHHDFVVSSIFFMLVIFRC